MKISIVIPSYNQADFIEKSILSVLEQDYLDKELVVIDGGSDDGTVDVIKKYESQLTYWVSEKDSGQSEAINKGFEKCTGEVFNWLASDDWLLPGALAKVAKEFKADAELDAVYGRGIIQRKNKSATEYDIQDASLENFIMRGNGISQPSAFVKSQLFKDVGLVRNDFHYTMDLDLWMKIVQKTDKLKKIDDLLSGILAHEDAKSFSSESAVKRMVEIMEIFAPFDSQYFESQISYVYSYILKTKKEPIGLILKLFVSPKALALEEVDLSLSNTEFVSSLKELYLSDLQKFQETVYEIYSYHESIRSIKLYKLLSQVVNKVRLLCRK